MGLAAEARTEGEEPRLAAKHGAQNAVDGRMQCHLREESGGTDAEGEVPVPVLSIGCAYRFHIVHGPRAGNQTLA